MPASGPSRGHPPLRGRDAVALLEIIRRCTTCATEDEFRGLFPSLQGLMAFDFAHALLARPAHDGSFSIAASINITFPDGWIRQYELGGYAQADPVIPRHFATYAVPDCMDPRLRRPAHIRGLCLDYRMNAGYTGGAPPSARERLGSMFCFKHSSRRSDRRARAILDLVAPHLHLAVSRIFAPPAVCRAVLSAREKQVMSWLAQGKSSWDISRIIRISERTVNFHIDNIRSKLGAVNRPQAVAIAARLGLIEVD